MKISVIIPALNEESVIGETLSDLVTYQHPDEVIVVDGESQDQTREIASQFAKVISSEQGRARQLNAGAQIASGDLFLFLHADTKLPEGGLELIRRGAFKAGRFIMRFNSDVWHFRLLASLSRFHCFSFGDQGFFVCRQVFDSLGGYREDVPFEDMEFYERLRKIEKPVIIKKPIVTSARRFLKKGSFKQHVINILLVSLYYSGFNVFSLRNWLYADVR